MQEYPWVTVRDAINDLPGPGKGKTSDKIKNHVFVPGAKAYGGHTGSPLDEPSSRILRKTLEKMSPEYPPAEEGLNDLVIK